MMLERIGNKLGIAVYPIAIAAGTLWNLVWLTSMPLQKGLLGLISSTLPVGLVIGLFKVDRWQDIFKKFPIALLCYFVVGIFYGLIGMSVEDYHGDMGGLAFVVIPMVVGGASPILLLTAFLVWAVKPSNKALLPPAAADVRGSK
jgi:hypothetical protein